METQFPEGYWINNEPLTDRPEIEIVSEFLVYFGCDYYEFTDVKGFTVHGSRFTVHGSRFKGSTVKANVTR